MLHGIVEEVAVEDIDIEVLTTIGSKVAVHEIDEVGHLIFVALTEGGGSNRPSVGNTVVRVVERQFGHRSERSNGAARVASVHGVGTGSKGRTRAAAARRVAGVLAIHHVGRDGEERLGGNGVAVSLVLTHVLHKLLRNHHCDGIGLVVVVAEGHIFAFLHEVGSETVFITDDAHLTKLDGSERVGDNRQTGNTTGTGTDDVAVVKRHFEGFVAVLVVHVVDDAESVAVDLGQPAHHLFKLLHHFFVVEILAGDGRVDG